MFPATGSMITAATWSPYCANAVRTAWASLNGNVNVCRATDSGTPGEFGKPSVKTPLPAFASSASEWPW